VPEHVRPARIDDAPEVGRLLTGALQSAGLSTTPGDPDLVGSMAAPGPDTGITLLGELDGVVVGVLCLRVERDRRGSTAVGRAADSAPAVGLVELVHVEPEAREMGIGALLLTSAVEWCRAHGVGTVEAQALPGDRTTKRLLEASGFRTRMLRMRLSEGSTASER